MEQSNEVQATDATQDPSITDVLNSFGNNNNPPTMMFTLGAPGDENMGIFNLENQQDQVDGGMQMNACRDKGTLRLFESNTGTITISKLVINLNLYSKDKGSSKVVNETEAE